VRRSAAGAVRIADVADRRLDPYRQLNDPARRATLEAGEGIFVVEGRLALEQLVGSPYPVASVLVADPRLEALAPLLAGLDLATPIYTASREVMASTVGFDIHRGVVAVGRRVAPADPGALVAGSDAVLVLEGVNDHENLGALFRNARALGAGAVLLDPTCADPLYRRSIRVSLGHVLRTPFARLDGWPASLSRLRAAGFTVVALTPDRSATPIEALSAGDVLSAGNVVSAADARVDEPGEGGRGRAKVALLVGAEGLGLTAAALDAADVKARIPMAPGVDSLNVATAAAIALHRLAGPPPA
jgi:tRNA G18 (ribose-2'-O)-methylase SpoU